MLKENSYSRHRYHQFVLFVAGDDLKMEAMVSVVRSNVSVILLAKESRLALQRQI